MAVTVLFAASEVGSVRALVPICQRCAERGIPFHVVERGYFVPVQDEAVKCASVEAPDTLAQLGNWLQALEITIVVFSVNNLDTHPLSIARQASAIGLPTLHVLDFWNGYRLRMTLDGLRMFVPSVYAMPDQFAADMGEKEGIDANIVEIVGQPAFHDVAVRAQQAAIDPECHIQRLLPTLGQRRLILFVSELVEQKQRDNAPNCRSHIEREAIALLVQALQVNPAHRDFYICALPHPRDDQHQLKTVWRALNGDPFGQVVTHINSRNLLPHATGVIGMSSTLLYESWLIGAPVLSIQPGLDNRDMWMMRYPQDIVLVDELEGAVTRVNAWLSALPPPPHQAREDIKQHAAAPDRIINRVLQLSH